MTTEVKKILTDWINSAKQIEFFFDLGEIDEQQYSIPILGANNEILFTIHCNSEWKPIFVQLPSEQKLSEWCLSINRYLQMFTNGASMDKFLEEIKKTFPKAFFSKHSTTQSPSSPSISFNTPPPPPPITITTPSMSVPTTTQSTSTPLSSVQEATGEIKKEVEEDRGDITRKQILSWINENTYVSLVLENLNKEAYQADFTIGNPKIPFKILFSNEWKPLMIGSDSPFLAEYIQTANLTIEERNQSKEITIQEFLNFIALGYTDIKNYLNEKNKEEQNNVDRMDIDSPPVTEEENPQLEKPTENDWKSIIIPELQKYLKSDNFHDWEIAEYIRRVEQIRVQENDEAALQFIRNEILIGSLGPEPLRKFVPKWNYYRARNFTTNAPLTDSKLLLGNKEASPEAIKKLQEEVENFKKLNCQALGFKAEPIKGNLFQWSVSFFDFNPHSKLGQELMEYTLRQIKSHELSQRNIKPLDILFELKFPFDYPNSPPLFRVIRPRLILSEGIEWDFNFDINNDRTQRNNTNQNTHQSFEPSQTEKFSKQPLSVSVQLEASHSRFWNSQIKLVDLIRRIRYLLETSDLSVDMTSTREGLPTIGAFWKSFKCVSTAKIGKEDFDIGNKVLLPGSVIDILYNDHDYLPSWRREFDSEGHPFVNNAPMIFEISTKSGKRSFCGVHEFTANEGEIAIPPWMMENLNIVDSDTVFVRRVNLPKATFLKLRPLSSNFLTLANAKPMLEWNLRRFVALSRGDTISLKHDNIIYKFDVVDVEPGHAVALTDSDVKVEFLTPFEEEARNEKTTTNQHSNQTTFQSLNVSRSDIVSSLEKNIFDSPVRPSSEQSKSLSGTLESDPSLIEGVHFKNCDVCRHRIPIASYQMHSISCPRMNWYCEMCKEVVKKTEKQKHLDDVHGPTQCSLCSASMEKRFVTQHLSNECPLRFVNCQYCELKIRFREKMEHETNCGAVTEPCPKCRKRVPRRDRTKHEIVCGTEADKIQTQFVYSGPKRPSDLPRFQNDDVLICEKCQHPCPNFEELQVHMLTVHPNDDISLHSSQEEQVAIALSMKLMNEKNQQQQQPQPQPQAQQQQNENYSNFQNN